MFKIQSVLDTLNSAYNMLRGGRSPHDQYDMPDNTQQPHTQMPDGHKMYDSRSVPGNVYPQTPGNPQHGFSSEPIGDSGPDEEEPEEHEEQEEVDEYDPYSINEQVIEQEFEDFHGRSIDETVDEDDDPYAEEMEDDDPMADDADLEDIVDAEE